MLIALEFVFGGVILEICKVTEEGPIKLFGIISFPGTPINSRYFLLISFNSL